MSYLAQLARETNARMIPQSTPSWMPTVNFAEETATAEWSGADAPARPAIPSPILSDATEVDRNPSLPDTQELPTSPRPVRSYQEKRDQEERNQEEKTQPALPLPVESKADSGNTATLLPRTSQPDRNAVPTQTAAPKRDDPPPAAIVYAASTPAPRPQAEPSRRHASEQQKPAVATPATEAALTLPDILAEMARRQEVLEARYRKEAETARAAQRPPESALPAHPLQESEHLRLNIGSIVVQVEPPPAPRANPPQTSPRQATRNFSSRRWARSFADR